MGMKDDFMGLLRQRKCIRSFVNDKPIPEDMLNYILEAGRLAPNAGNLQAWRFFIVRDKKRKDSIAEAAYGQSFLAEAPVVVIAAFDMETIQSGYGKRGLKLYGFQDTAAAIENMLLAARVLGIGSCWVGAYDDNLLVQTLGIDAERYRTVAVIPFGYSKENPPDRGRKSLDEIVAEID
ncbi:MAG: nitroreductase family protein [Spirochaetales bacterium]|nr:nitroreductase family protein [Spirochaetales bacterium]